MKNFLKKCSFTASRCPNGLRIVIGFAIHATINDLTAMPPDSLGNCAPTSRITGTGTPTDPYRWDCIDGNAIAKIHIKQSTERTDNAISVTAIINLPQDFEQYVKHRCGVLIQQTKDDGTPIPTEEEDDSMLTANAGIGIGTWC